MIKSSLLGRGIITSGRWRSVFTIFWMAVGISLLVSGGMVVAFLLAGRFGDRGFYAVGGAIVASLLALIVVLRQDAMAATVLIAVQLYVDWYLGLHIVSQVLLLVLLSIFFLARSPRYPWAEPRAMWLWGLFLVLAILPAIRGAVTLYDAAYYYPNVIFGALSFFWLGTVIARNSACVRRLFKMLAGFATLIAIHTIIQATTGTFLFGTAHFDTFLQGVSDYQLSGNIVTHRVGSFFVDPNWDGTFFAMMLFLPLGLFLESPSFQEKVLYLGEVALMLPALLFTYSIGAWIGALGGMIAFFLFVGRARYRVLLPFIVLATVLGLLAFLPDQIGLLLQRTVDPSEAALRLAAWQTGLKLIGAYPLTGIGLSQTLFNSYSVLYTGSPGLGHPHNSYLELGAMAGLPVLLVFIALLAFALWQAYRNWALADVRTRSLIGAGVAAAVALSVNSVSINGWTMPPLAVMGWLILGTITSPLLSSGLSGQMAKQKSNVRGLGEA